MPENRDTENEIGSEAMFTKEVYAELMGESSGTYRYPFKCSSCSLHFNVYSWYEDGPKPDVTKCPACGENRLMRWAPKKMEKQIFEYVPGSSPGLKSIPQ